MRLLSSLLFSMALLGLFQSNVAGQEKKEEPKGKGLVVPPAPAPSFKNLDGRKIVFVANGAGGSTMTSDNLLALNGDKHLGLMIKPVAWCRQNSTRDDVLDQDAQMAAASRIAGWTKGIRKDSPNAEIYYIGHSAGARIALTAAEMAGDKSVDRVILLHAAVAQNYNLKPALKASRYGIDSFYATEDNVLDHARESFGLADGSHAHAGGRLGFGPIDRKDEAYRNFRQYRWDASMHGNGGHYAWVIQHNMKKALVPLFFTR